jgi:hypothetical protein
LASAAVPATAQPGASWTETGVVDILVRDEGVLTGRQASEVLETDVIDSIEIGDTGIVGDQDPGTLYIEGIGTPAVPRDLGEVSVLVGQLEVNNVIVDAGFIRVGSTIDGQFSDPSEGTMVVRLSDVREQVVVRKGLLTCQASSMSFAVLDAGVAQIDDCLIRSASGTGLSQTSIVGSTILGVGFRGTTSVSDSSIESSNGTVVEGTITIGNSAPVFWDDSGTIVVGQNVHTTDLTVSSGSTVEAQSTDFRGGGITTVRLQSASTWRTFDLHSVRSATLDVVGASRIDARGDLEISGGSPVTVGSGLAADSHIDVAGDLKLGQTGTTFTSGTLTIEDGGYVSVDGTLYIRPAATLNLNGGTLRVTNLVEEGTLNENGGTLIVPEAGALSSAIAAVLGLALVAPRSRRRDALLERGSAGAPSSLDQEEIA